MIEPLKSKGLQSTRTQWRLHPASKLTEVLRLTSPPAMTAHPQRAMSSGSKIQVFTRREILTRRKTGLNLE